MPWKYRRMAPNPVLQIREELLGAIEREQVKGILKDGGRCGHGVPPRTKSTAHFKALDVQLSP